MRTIASEPLLGLVLSFGVGLGPVSAQAAPEYEADPFGDADFDAAPLILELNHPTKGHGEASLLFSTSVGDKYSSHLGGSFEVSYHILETLGVGLSFGFLHGQLSSIVTDDLGIIGNGVSACISDESKCGEVDANVPDYKQITGMADLVAIWSPLYGKVNLVSEIDLNLQIYGVGGFGINGTRTVQASLSGRPSLPSHYTLYGGGLFEGGAFSNLKVNTTLGVGMKIYLLRRLALRIEARGLFFRDTFDFDENGIEKSYLSSYWFGHAGLSFTLF